MKTLPIALHPFADAIQAWIDSARREGSYYDVRNLMAHGSHEARLEFMRRPFFPRHDGPWHFIGRVGRAVLWRAPETGRYYAFMLDRDGYLAAEAVGASRDVVLQRLLRRLPRLPRTKV
jgi:hypothetical protein